MNKKLMIFLYLCLLCFSQIVNAKSMSLNGDWQFNTFLGDGSAYRQISVQAQDIVIDNSQTNLVKAHGNWKLRTEPERDSQQWGQDYLKFNYWQASRDIRVEFNYPNIKPGYYEHFVFYPFGANLNMRYSVHHANGVDEHYISQRNKTGQWVSLGIYQIDDPAKSRILVSSNASQPGVADAVMLRPVSAEAWHQAQQKKAMVMQPSFDDSQWHRLTVPGHWGMLNQYSSYTGKGWYRKQVFLDSDWQAEKNERIWLQFDGVYHLAKVYLNGQYIGQHRGGFTPFEFDVTEHIKAGQQNLLAVQADNSKIVGATWNWGGIIRDVNLRKTKDTRITYQYIHAEPDLNKGDADLTLKMRVKNYADEVKSLTLKADVLRASDTPLTQMKTSIKLAANSEKTIVLKSKLTPEQVALWHFDRPNLYQLSSQVFENEKLLSQRTDRFGIRKVELTDSQMLLNGEAVRIGGFNRISDHRYWGSSEALELLKQDIRLMKDAGANFMRIMHGTQNKKLIELCDENGILIFEEVNVRTLTNPEFQAPDYEVNRQWLREMIERDINHPSIIGWSVGNELKDHYRYAQQMIAYVKNELDPHRLVTNVSNTGYRDGDSADNDPLGFSDLMMQNIYQKDPERVVTTLAERWPNRPLFISEYGLGRFTTPSLDNDYPNFASWHEMIRGRNTHVIGTSIWSFNDYRSGYSQTLEEDNRAWGLVNAWRQKRRAYKRVQAEMSPLKAVKMLNFNLAEKQAEVVLDPRNADDYPAYRMQDYRLHWQLVNQRGELLEAYQQKLPTLSPASKDLHRKLSWQTEKAEIFALQLQIKSSNGFIRYQDSWPIKAPLSPKIVEVETSNNQIRVHLAPQADASEFQLNYRILGGEWQQTEQTIDPIITINNVEKGAQYQLKANAINDYASTAAKQLQTVTAKGAQLAPRIWFQMIRDKRLIIGFTGHISDQQYQLEYGLDPNQFTHSERLYARGMITAELADMRGVIYYRLRRVTEQGTSQWSSIKQIKHL
ncbi:glycoside hydrolase family 2 TIM barrel-domain containing protein [Gayadomonas joobiniege]|uniref:glycoside hydrolase family 2 TIM barrel-domain containing protein n=1 Tax=Gayadomonas joobiniege TaxID=1234606 RepID=UPI000AF130BC|nr:glycoside hydrolase family 2 TIM barrel-domain containing protein [Gayadomonas joobiniege]